MNELSLHIIDIIQNSLSAGAGRITVCIDENIAADTLTIAVRDNGKGMSPDQVGRLSDPFFTSRTTRRVGMGIPLFRQSAEQAGGTLSVHSEHGKGTTVTATFRHSHLDRPPMGDLAGSFVLMAGANPGVDFVLEYSRDGKDYRFDTEQAKEILEDIPICEPAVIKMLKEMIDENLESLSKSF